MTSSLSPQDVDRLLSEGSPEVHAELAGKVAANLTEPGLSPAEIALAQDIVRILARHVAANVRASVAVTLRNSMLLPLDVARAMAEDIDLVALPVLAEFLVLSDQDLVQLVRRGSAAKQETIATRPNLAEEVSGALIEHAGAPAVATLMNNHTARIAEQSLDRSIARFGDSDLVKHAMVSRPVLPISIAEQLVALVSQEWQQRLVSSHALPASLASDIVLHSREHAVLHLSLGSSEEELVAMVAQMHRNGRLTPTMVLRAICTGDVAFFEAAMAIKGDVPAMNAQRLIHDTARGLEALYRKAAMPAKLFAAIRAAVEAIDETRFDGDERELERFRARIISRVLTVTETLDPTDADYLVNVLGDSLPRAAE